jgi:sugar/nucleoside kinase (ribokinase family)
MTPRGRAGSRVVVAGVVNVRMARGFAAFPIPYESSVCDPEGISVRLSGTGWTLARTLQQLGTAVSFATYVGADPLGQLVVHGLAQHGLYGPATQVCAAQPRAIVLYDSDGKRSSATDLRSTPDLRYPTEAFLSAVDCPDRCDAAMLTNIGFTRSLLPIAVSRGVPVVTDLHIVDSVDSVYNRQWMHSAYLLACSHEGLPSTPEVWVREMWQRYGTELVLVGCGSGGAVLGVRTAQRIWHVRASVPRGVRYTSGAGDTLLASFVHHYFDSGDAVAAARNAVLTAGWKVGGSPDDDAGVARATLSRIRAAHGLPEARLLS